MILWRPLNCRMKDARGTRPWMVLTLLPSFRKFYEVFAGQYTLDLLNASSSFRKYVADVYCRDCVSQTASWSLDEFELGVHMLPRILIRRTYLILLLTARISLHRAICFFRNDGSNDRTTNLRNRTLPVASAQNLLISEKANRLRRRESLC